MCVNVPVRVDVHEFCACTCAYWVLGVGGRTGFPNSTTKHAGWPLCQETQLVESANLFFTVSVDSAGKISDRVGMNCHLLQHDI